ncbi:MAG: hypothetical protein GKC03_02400 [Methanomassiliicoccales archaeon]|nr:hypothetical protein [Methanomassiliicoccales archaeon]NYT14944.1 hypothetical protein [Methanomassiliicoccales archaeon]
MTEWEDDVVESEEDLRNDEWFKENLLVLMEEHSKEWIAVIDCEIIATGTTLAEVEENALEVSGDREFSVYFVPATPF